MLTFVASLFSFLFGCCAHALIPYLQGRQMGYFLGPEMYNLWVLDHVALSELKPFDEGIDPLDEYFKVHKPSIELYTWDYVPKDFNDYMLVILQLFIDFFDWLFLQLSYFCHELYVVCIKIPKGIIGHLLSLIYQCVLFDLFWLFDIIESILPEYTVDEYYEWLLTIDIDEPLLNWDLIIVWVQVLACAAFTIWARGVGPRFRPDQMSDLTWKDILIILFFLFVLLLSLVIAVRCVMTLLVLYVIFLINVFLLQQLISFMEYVLSIYI